MNLPDWVAGTGWGIFFLIIALLLSQAKVFGDLWIWKKSRNQIDSYLSEIEKALAIEKDMQDCPEAARDIRQFVATSTKFVNDYNEYRISQERKSLTRVSSGGNALIARKAALVVRNGSWLLLSLYGVYFGGWGLALFSGTLIDGRLFGAGLDTQEWLIGIMALILALSIFLGSSLSFYWSLKSLWHGGLGKLFNRLFNETASRSGTD